MVILMKVVGKNARSTDMVFIDIKMAQNTGVFGRMVIKMAKDGSSFRMGLVMAWNLRPGK